MYFVDTAYVINNTILNMLIFYCLCIILETKFIFFQKFFRMKKNRDNNKQKPKFKKKRKYHDYQKFDDLEGSLGDNSEITTDNNDEEKNILLKVKNKLRKFQNNSPTKEKIVSDEQINFVNEIAKKTNIIQSCEQFEIISHNKFFSPNFFFEFISSFNDFEVQIDKNKQDDFSLIIKINLNEHLNFQFKLKFKSSDDYMEYQPIEINKKYLDEDSEILCENLEIPKEDLIKLINKFISIKNKVEL